MAYTATPDDDDQPSKQILIPSEMEQDELQELLQMLRDIRRRTGFGRLLVTIKYNEIHDIEFTVQRKPKREPAKEKRQTP